MKNREMAGKSAVTFVVTTQFVHYGRRKMGSVCEHTLTVKEFSICYNLAPDELIIKFQHMPISVLQMTSGSSCFVCVQVIGIYNCLGVCGFSSSS